jgi:hypothetical protein
LITLTLAPYFVLRYFAGGVDLWFEASMVAMAVMISGLLTAAALAMSGFKISMRVAWIAKVVFGNVLLLGVFLSGALTSSWMMKGVNAFRGEWLVLGFLAALGTAVILRLAGDSMDVASANGALFPRLGIILGWLLVPLVHALNFSTGFEVFYLCFLTYLTTWVFMWHLHGLRPVFGVQIRPFRRLGGFLGRIGVALFLPNWVGIPVLVLFPLAAFLFLIWVLSKHTQEDWIFLGMAMHAVCYVSFCIVMWRLFFASRRDANGVLHERDPRIIFGWLLGVSWIFAPLPNLLQTGKLLCPVGIVVPVFFAWTYADNQIKGFSESDFLFYMIFGAVCCLTYLGLALWLGIQWLSRKGVWDLFAAPPAGRAVRPLETSGLPVSVDPSPSAPLTFPNHE